MDDLDQIQQIANDALAKLESNPLATAKALAKVSLALLDMLRRAEAAGPVSTLSVKQYRSLAGYFAGMARTASEGESTKHLIPGLEKAAELMRENAEIEEAEANK